MKPEEELVSKCVLMDKFLNYEGNVTKGDRKHVVIISCYEDPSRDGFIVNGGYFMTYDEADGWLNES